VVGISFERFLDVDLFKLGYCFVEQYPAVEHLSDQ